MMLNDYTVPDKEFFVSVNMEFKSESSGAQTSGTDAAHQGIKPKVVTVNLLIAHNTPDLLKRLTAIAESTKADGSLTTYNITDDTCNAMNIRQVTFADNLSVRDDASLKAWLITFGLVEYKSVPEKVEKRQTTAAPKAQSATGTTVAGEQPAAEQEEQTAPLTGFESGLSYFNKILAPSS